MRNKSHSNEDLIRTDTSEGLLLRQSIGFRTTVDWRILNKRIPFADNKSKQEFQLAKREADLNFKNETVVRYKAY